MTIAAAPAVLRGRYRMFAQSAYEYSARAISLVQSAMVVDLLNQFQSLEASLRPGGGTDSPRLR
jgi:hypothetical protein